MAHKDHKIEGVNTAGVPSCTIGYAKAVMDPFADVPDVCMPSTLLPLPSRKYTTRATVQWSTGTGGVGGVCVQPQLTWTGGLPNIYASTSGFAGVPGSVVDATALGMSFLSVQAPTNNAPNNNILGRLATFGSRTKSVTPGMTRGGVMFSDIVAERTEIQVAGLARTWAQCFSDTAAIRVPFGTGDTRMDTTACGPALPAHLDFTPTDNPFMQTVYFMVGAFSSEPQSFITEFVFYWEIIEQLNPSGLTPSHAEPSYAGAVVSAINTVVLANPGGESHRSTGFLSRLKGLVKDGWDALRPVARVAAPLARAALNFVPAVGPALSAATQAIGPMAARLAQRAVARAIAPRGGARPQARIAAKRR